MKLFVKLEIESHRCISQTRTSNLPNKKEHKYLPLHKKKAGGNKLEDFCHKI